MALDTYSGLLDTINGFLDHTLFSARGADFVTLFEATGNRTLFAREQETTVSITPSGGSVALPTDYLLWRRVTWLGDPYRELGYVAPSYFQTVYPTSASSPVGTAIPVGIFTIEGANILIKTSSTTAVQLDYYAKIPALSVTNTTNWLLLAHPDVYLFGALLEAEAFGMNDERMPMWKQRRDEAIGQIQRLSNKSKGTGGMRVMGPTP